jgi:hypothetical protein
MKLYFLLILFQIYYRFINAKIHLEKRMQAIRPIAAEEVIGKYFTFLI